MIWSGPCQCKTGDQARATELCVTVVVPEGAIPYDGARCAEQVGYRPEKARKAVPIPGRGACTRDGECLVSGCGNECVSTNEVNLAGTCEHLSGLAKRGLCGCVDGDCRWFVQE